MADTILIVDDEQIIRESASFILKKEGFRVEEAPNGRVAYDKFVEKSYDLVITDLEMPEMKGMELLEKIKELSPQTIVVIITAYGSMETAIAALRKGANDYILKPIEFDELTLKIRRLLEHRKLIWENQYLREEASGGVDFKNLIGQSPAMERIFDTVRRISATDGTVLITGKSGTGKEMVARAVHANSPRADRPFIAVNCGAIPESLIESELFGHKKGSFTGALADRGGYFKAADGGTLLLDEISEMPVQLQVKLLRAIEQKEIVPVGTSEPQAVDVRFIATTNPFPRKIFVGDGQKDAGGRPGGHAPADPPPVERGGPGTGEYRGACGHLREGGLHYRCRSPRHLPQLSARPLRRRGQIPRPGGERPRQGIHRRRPQEKRFRQGKDGEITSNQPAHVIP